ncbi:hypothetical protein TD95_005330, partial [Thielaviopsis punctulata]
ANPFNTRTTNSFSYSLLFTNQELAIQKYGQPVLQCLQVRPLMKEGQSGSDRYRLTLSDSEHYVQGVMGPQLSHLYHDGKLKPDCMVRLGGGYPSGVANKRILVVAELDVLGEYQPSGRIGAPKMLEIENPSAATGAGAAAPAPIAPGNFYGSKPEDKKPKPAPRQSYGGGRAASANSGTVSMIESISPYNNKWTVKGRVTSKSDIRTWHKPTGEGKLFSFNLLDESGEIRVTCFNEQVDQYYEMLEQGAVYYVSTPCRVIAAKRQFNTLPHEYEIIFERDTVLKKAEDQDSSVPQIMFNFHTIQELQNIEKDSILDIIGVIKEVGELTSLVSKNTGKPFEKREVTIVDDTNYSVRVTVWGKTANTFDGCPEQVVAFKGVKVSDFGGKSLSLLSSGSMVLDPDHESAHRLKGWYDAQGRTDSFLTHNNMASAGAATGRVQVLKLISQIKEENLGMEQDDYFDVRGTVVFIRQENFAYPACPTERCNKKVIMDGDSWRCEKCNMSHDRPQFRYIMSINVSDHTGQLWLSCFDDVGRVVMGMSGDELMALREENGEVGTAPAFENATCQTYTFRVRAKMDTYQEQQRVRYQALTATPIDFSVEGRKMVEMIKQLSM